MILRSSSIICPYLKYFTALRQVNNYKKSMSASNIFIAHLSFDEQLNSLKAVV